MRRSIPALALLGLSLTGCPSGSSSPEVRPAVVFDIDGTLTTEPFDPITPRDGAQEAVRRYVAKGYEVVYVSARPDLFESATSAWLRVNDFPDLRLEMAPDLVVDDDETARFKVDLLEDLERELGIDFVYGYGDSTSDFVAYQAVGIESAGSFALLRDEETVCEPGVYAACLSDFVDHLEFIDGRPDE